MRKTAKKRHLTQAKRTIVSQKGVALAIESDRGLFSGLQAVNVGPAQANFATITLAAYNATHSLIRKFLRQADPRSDSGMKPLPSWGNTTEENRFHIPLQADLVNLGKVFAALGIRRGACVGPGFTVRDLPRRFRTKLGRSRTGNTDNRRRHSDLETGVAQGQQDSELAGRDSRSKMRLRENARGNI